jgi:hypothetical protein
MQRRTNIALLIIYFLWLAWLGKDGKSGPQKVTHKMERAK